MVSDTRSARNSKDEGYGPNLKLKAVVRKDLKVQVQESQGSGARRSAREASDSPTQMVPSPHSMQKTKRLEEGTPPSTPSTKRKSGRLEKSNTPSPVGAVKRSIRSKNELSPDDSSGSKESAERIGPLDSKRKKQKNLIQVTLESKKAEIDPEVGTKRKKMNARSFMAMFKRQRIKIASDGDEVLEGRDKLSNVYSDNNEGIGSERMGNGVVNTDERSRRVVGDSRDPIIDIDKASGGTLQKSCPKDRCEDIQDNVNMASSHRNNVLDDHFSNRSNTILIFRETSVCPKRLPTKCSSSENRDASKSENSTCLGKIGDDSECSSIDKRSTQLKVAEDNPSPSPTLDTRVLCSEIKRSEGMSGGRSVSSDEQTTPQSSLQEETKRLCRVLKFSKKIRKLRERLLRRHELELQEFHEKWNREKIKLEMDHKLESAFVRAVHGQSVIGIDRLKLLNTDFKMKMEELVSQKDLELKALEARQLEEINLVEAKAKAYLSGPGSVGELQSLAPQPEEHAGEDFQPCRQSDEAIGCETRVENPETVSAQNEDGGNVSQPKQTGDNEEAAFMNPAASVERVSDALVDERSRPDEVASEDSQGLKQQLVQSKENAPLTDCGNTLSQQVQQDKPNHSLAPAVENQTTLQNQTEPIDTVNPVLPNHEEAPVANEYVIHVPSDHETVTREPTNNETVTREPAGAKTLTCEPTDNETETHVPKGTETLTCEPTNNETVTHVPKGTKTVIREPTDNEIVTHEPMGTKTVTRETREPTDNETVAHVPTGTETVTHEPTGIETVTREPTDNETVAHVPTGTETVTHVPTCIETVTREPTDNETVAHVPTGIEILTPVPSDHETAAQITSDHGTVAQLPSNPGQNAVVPAVSENCVTTPSQIVVSTAEWLNEAVFQLGSDASHSEEPNYLVHPSHQLAYGSSPPSSSIDPLQIEIDKLRKETEQLDKYHRELVLRLQYDCEKEIQDIINQIRNKYNTKLQEAETELKSKRNELDKNHNKVVMNKLLAAAFRSKCWNPKFALVPGMQQGVPPSFLQHMQQLPTPPGPTHPFAAPHHPLGPTQPFRALHHPLGPTQPFVATPHLSGPTQPFAATHHPLGPTQPFADPHSQLGPTQPVAATPRPPGHTQPFAATPRPPGPTQPVTATPRPPVPTLPVASTPHPPGPTQQPVAATPRPPGPTQQPAAATPRPPGPTQPITSPHLQTAQPQSRAHPVRYSSSTPIQMSRPVQAVQNTAALFSTPLARSPLVIGTVTPSCGAHRPGGEIRSAAPHLQSFRPPPPGPPVPHLVRASPPALANFPAAPRGGVPSANTSFDLETLRNIPQPAVNQGAAAAASFGAGDVICLSDDE